MDGAWQEELYSEQKNRQTKKIMMMGQNYVLRIAALH
jgi:hypothetical protein